MENRSSRPQSCTPRRDRRRLEINGGSRRICHSLPGHRNRRTHERQEVLDLTALTRALLHPADRVAALAVLRAPWCGLSLADLHTLTGTDDPDLKDHSILRLMDERGHLLPDDSCKRLQRVWQVLAEAAVQRARLTPAQLVERAWRSLGGDAMASPTRTHQCRPLPQAPR